jgi:DnaJ-class molecular chaperone
MSFRTEERQCKECGGKGAYKHSRYKWKRCKKCNGTGTIRIDVWELSPAAIEVLEEVFQEQKNK